mmetsp:Transcript_129584/g.242456  ORF Transcript_129584/g.242456 Transcript_129584/m.242456 type:complete len:196 (-) Transcript_129584:71-658(-)
MSTWRERKRELKKYIKEMNALMEDARMQCVAADRLYNVAKDETNSNVVVAAGGVKLLVNAMQKHPSNPDLQRGAAITFQRCIERGGEGGVPAAKAILAAGAVGFLGESLQRFPQNTSLQAAIAGLFRQLVRRLGQPAAEAVEAENVINALASIEEWTNDANAKFQAVKALEIIQKALPPPPPEEEVADDDGAESP